LTLHRIAKMHAAGEPITMLTCYDASFARLLDEAGVDCLLVGDSLGMVLQGESSTVPVTLERGLSRGAASPRHRGAGLIGDLPFASYQQSPRRRCTAPGAHAGGAQMVKLEAAAGRRDGALLTERGVPVCAHLGLTPQSVHALGGYACGRDDAAAATLSRHARELADAGAACWCWS